MLRRLILFLAFIPSLFASQNSSYELATFGGEPSTVVAGCVSALSGDFFINQTDLTVRSHEPISIQRRYYSRHATEHLAGWSYGFNHLYAVFTRLDTVLIPEKAGFTLTISATLNTKTKGITTSLF